MQTIEQQNYVLDVIVKKLSVSTSPNLNPQDIILQFDRQNVSPPITQSQVKSSNGPDRTDEAKFMSNQLNHDYKKGFKLTIYEKDENDMRVGVVGEVYCDWEMKEPEQWINGPYERTYNIYKDGVFAGTISLSIVAIRKCDDIKGDKTSTKPLAEQDGSLSVFEEMKRNLNPKDVFFVVGEQPNIAGGDGNPFTQCKQADPCRFDLDHTRYQVVQGKLVKDFSILQNCDNDECCANGALFEEFDEIFKRKPSKRSSTVSTSVDRSVDFGSETMTGSKESCQDRKETEWQDCPCRVLFGPSSKRTMEHQRNKRASRGTSIHMSDCPVKLAKIRPIKKSETNFRSRSCTETLSTKSAPSTSCPSTSKGTPTHVNSLVNKIIKSAKKCQEEQVPPRTCSTPKLVKSNFQIFPRFCPICCEDVSWLQPQALCPKCGFKSKIGLPIETSSYNENETAKDVLYKWRTNVEKHKKKKDINPLGICLCSKNKECINCQIRHTSQKPGETVPESRTNQFIMQKAVERIAEAEKTKAALCRKNMVTRIVEEVLSQPLRRPTMNIEKLLIKRDTEPDIAKAFRWAKNQLPQRKTLLDSTSDISEHSRTSLLKTLHKAAEKEDSDSEKAKINKVRNDKGRDKKNLVSKAGKQCDILRQCKAKYFECCKQRGRYPPRVFGHYFCKPKPKPVPKNMGWYWNIDLQGERRGWQPGAIYRKTRKIMDFFKGEKAEAAAIAQRNKCEMVPKRLEKPKETKLPRLHIKKHKGQYVVTAYPLCDPNLPPSEMTEKMKPIEFTISPADNAVKRKEVMEYFQLIERMKLDPCSIDFGFENEKVLKAINNLKDLLRTETLRNILQCDSESDGSMDIDLGGGTAQKPVFKQNVGIQIEDGINHSVSIPLKKGMHYKNSYNNTCIGPFDKPPSDSEFRPKRIPAKKPQSPFVPKFTRPNRLKKQETKPKGESTPDQKDNMEHYKKPRKPKPGGIPKADLWRGKITMKKDKVKKEDPDKIKPIVKRKKEEVTKEALKKDISSRPENPEKISEPPSNEVHEDSNGEKKRNLSKRKSRKTEIPDEIVIEDRPSAKKPSFLPPPPSDKRRSKIAKNGDDHEKEKKKSIEVPPIIIPPKKHLVRPPYKPKPSPFEYSPPKLKRKTQKPCVWQEACSPSPLTTVNFKAHGCKDNFTWETEPKGFAYANMNELYPHRNLTRNLQLNQKCVA